MTREVVPVRVGLKAVAAKGIGETLSPSELYECSSISTFSLPHTHRVLSHNADTENMQELEHSLLQVLRRRRLVRTTHIVSSIAPLAARFYSSKSYQPTAMGSR